MKLLVCLELFLGSERERMCFVCSSACGRRVFPGLFVEINWINYFWAPFFSLASVSVCHCICTVQFLLWLLFESFDVVDVSSSVHFMQIALCM